MVASPDPKSKIYEADRPRHMSSLAQAHSPIYDRGGSEAWISALWGWDAWARTWCGGWCAAGHRVVAWNRSRPKIDEVAGEGAVAAYTIDDLVKQLQPRRVIWMMVPGGRSRWTT